MRATAANIGTGRAAAVGRIALYRAPVESVTVMGRRSWSSRSSLPRIVTVTGPRASRYTVTGHTANRHGRTWTGTLPAGGCITPNNRKRR